MQNTVPPSITPETTSPQTLNLNNNTTANWAISQNYLQQQVRGARWFYWVAALSLINAVIVHANGRWSFLAGLGITLLISGFATGLAEGLGSGVIIVAIALEFLVAALFGGFGYFASKGHSWAFIVGAVVYLLDGLIFLLFGDWFALAFHAFVLFSLYKGFDAARSYQRLQSEGMA